MACADEKQIAAKVDETASVLNNVEVAPGFWRMQLAAPQLGPRFMPGQFFQIRVHPQDNAPLLRRPFAPSECSAEGFSFVYAIVGEGTRALTRLPVGAPVQVLGPLGHGYNISPDHKRIILVGGGCGTPSLRVLAEDLVKKNIEVYTVIGARSSCTLLERDALGALSTKLVVATDDGSEGHHGHAVDATRILLNEIGLSPKPVLCACGPHPMLKGLSTFARETGLECQVSLEERMACGFGACMGCAVKVNADNEDGFVYKRVCYDGPVFNAEELVW